MFDRLMALLKSGTADPLPKEDAQLAMAALLVRVARIDHDYAPAEQELISSLLMQLYDLSAPQAAELRTNAEAVEADAPDTVRFTRVIKDTVPYEERISVIESLWHVVLADKIRTDDENSLLRMVTNLLGVTDQDSARARQRVEQSLQP